MEVLGYDDEPGLFELAALALLEQLGEQAAPTSIWCLLCSALCAGTAGRWVQWRGCDGLVLPRGVSDGAVRRKSARPVW